MKICLVATFPPSGRQLNEYAFHLARELQRNSDVNLTILADELTDYEFATDANGNPWRPEECSELPGFRVIRCWKIWQHDDPAAPIESYSQAETRCGVVQPGVLELRHPGETRLPHLPGFLRRRLARASGFYTHITLHHIIEHVDFAAAGVRRERIVYAWAPMWLPGRY